MTEVVDSHVHIWGPHIAALDWLSGSEFPSQVGLDDVAGDRGVVLVTADAVGREAEREAEYFSRLALTDPRVHGFVAGIDLTGPNLANDLIQLRTLPGLVGVRHNLQDVIETLSREQLARGLCILADVDIPFDACVRHHELGLLADLLERVPHVRVVLDHMGKPPVGNRQNLVQWGHHIERLAARPQTWCKLSGLPAECASSVTLCDEALPALAACVQAFGADRCMFGSDQPISVDPHWLDRVRAATDPSEHGRVLHDVAINFYRRLQ